MSRPKRFPSPKHLPLLIVLATAAAFGLLLLSGGMRKVYAWNMLSLVLPVIGLFGLIFSIVRLIVRRRLDAVTIATGVVSLLAILTALSFFFPLAYPASLARTGPSATVRLPADGPLKVAWGGDALRANQHVVVPDQRWAYDLVVAPDFTGSPRPED